MTDTRKHLTAEQKIAILRRHLLEQIPVSDLCDECGIKPSVSYRWQQQLLRHFMPRERRSGVRSPIEGSI
jgi:transposase